MAAYRQAKRMQRGVLTAQGGFSTTDPALLHVPCTIQCVFVPQTFESRQCVFDTRGSNASPRIDILENGRMSIYYSGTNKTIDISIGTLYNITFVTTETEQSVYVGGELLGSAPYSTPQFAYYVIGALTGRFMYRFKGDYLLHRHFNYAMSADEVKALDNNGDPMGYVVPKASRYFEKSYQSNFTDGTDGWTGYGSSSGLLIESKEGILEISGDYANYQIRMPYPPAPKCASRYKMRVEFAEPVSISRYALYAFTGNSAFQENVTEPKTILDGVTPLDNNLSQYCYIYLYGITPNTVVRIKSVTIEPAGLLAEYLPQNLMASRKGPEIEPTADTFEFNIGSPYSMKVIAQQTYPFDCIYKVDYVVDEWDFQPSVYRLIGFYGESGASVVAGVSSWIRASDAKIGEVQSCFIKMPNEGNPSILLYGDQDRDITTARHLKVTINSITPVSVPISWLDSAKQLPLSDEYMEPLFQSIGGYDMAANGAPEILYNE